MEACIIDVDEAMLPQLELIERQSFSCPWTLEQLRAQLKDDRHEFIAAVDESGRALGYVGMAYVIDEGYISNVAVSAECRRRGLGERLVGELLCRAGALRLSFVTLEVRESNVPAIALYAKLGFQPVGRRRAYYDMPKEDAILMTNFLNRGKESENTCV